MARRKRQDAPGRRHHVFNRGVAKRPLFPDPPAKTRLLALFACAVRRGEIAIEAFCVLDTHFHAVFRTKRVPLAYPLMRIENAYSRYFNRRFKRDGSPLRGRYGSVPILGVTHALACIRYIDANPVKARLCAHPTDYAFGSARLYATRQTGPLWLSREVVEARVRALVGASDFRCADYLRFFGPPITDAEAEVVERRLEGKAGHEDELDHVMRMPTPAVAAWMRRKAMLADGLSPWAPIVAGPVVLELIAEARAGGAVPWVTFGRKRWDGWSLLEVGLLHDTAGRGCEEIARGLGCASSTAGRRLRAHRLALEQDTGYAALAGQLVREALDRTYPWGAPA